MANSIQFRVLLLALVFVFGRAADPDPVSDFYNSTSPFSFHNILKNGDVTDGPGGKRAGLTTNLFPAMQSQGLTVVHFILKPCGVNLPHTHPRATEMLSLISGGPIQVGFVDTEGEVHVDILRPGDVTIFPRALMHFELNVGAVPAYFVSALNSQSPGTLTAGGALLSIPARTAATALNQKVDYIKKLKETSYEYGPHLQLAPFPDCIPGKDITTAI